MYKTEVTLELYSKKGFKVVLTLILGQLTKPKNIFRNCWYPLEWKVQGFKNKEEKEEVHEHLWHEHIPNNFKTARTIAGATKKANKRCDEFWAKDPEAFDFGSDESEPPCLSLLLGESPANELALRPMLVDPTPGKGAHCELYPEVQTWDFFWRKKKESDTEGRAWKPGLLQRERQDNLEPAQQEAAVMVFNACAYFYSEYQEGAQNMDINLRY